MTFYAFTLYLCLTASPTLCMEKDSDNVYESAKECIEASWVAANWYQSKGLFSYKNPVCKEAENVI